MAPSEQFTQPGMKAFNPVIVGTDDKRIAVSWRDQNRGGTTYLRGAAIGVTGVRGADMALTWGEPLLVSLSQAHKTALVSLPQNRVALMWSEKTIATKNTPVESFGSSMLAEVNATGSVHNMGTWRFSDSGVCRLEVTKVSPTGFIIAMRATPALDEIEATTTHQEAIAMYGEMVDNNLVFDPNPVNLEPQKTKIWARGISLIAPHTFAYSYQVGENLKIKTAVIEVDPSTKQMHLVQSPVVVHNGFSRYVSMLDVPYTAADPHTLSYYEHQNKSMVSLCSYTTEKKLGQCEDFQWLDQKVRSVHGVHLGGGKAFMVFAPESGVPYYGIFGLSKK
eukprot:gnl/TRDRNA2_/TRDRNA2_44397_c0_seq1.p1 gnl/TRDRNA2_/TRDRNA2_44397_c0~~gnl/TRDRNA2_/TRDRNA2_44397_c0_seq1.p1  ORF type:complete len:355 (+),score=79.48 gnl/TRDRNA2_/TRDRNA2_44397_c0_seq1:62-1066(+)